MSRSRSRWQQWLCGALVVLTLLMSSPAAWAEACPHDNNRGVTQRIVNCVNTAIDNAADTYVSHILDYMKRAIFAAVTIAAALYGANLASSGRFDVKEGFILLFKVGAIFYFLTNFAEVLKYVEDIMT